MQNCFEMTNQIRFSGSRKSIPDEWYAEFLSLRSVRAQHKYALEKLSEIFRNRVLGELPRAYDVLLIRTVPHVLLAVQGIDGIYFYDDARQTSVKRSVDVAALRRAGWRVNAFCDL